MLNLKIRWCNSLGWFLFTGNFRSWGCSRVREAENVRRNIPPRETRPRRGYSRVDITGQSHFSFRVGSVRTIASPDSSGSPRGACVTTHSDPLDHVRTTVRARVRLLMHAMQMRRRLTVHPRCNVHARDHTGEDITVVLSRTEPIKWMLGVCLTHWKYNNNKLVLTAKAYYSKKKIDSVHFWNFPTMTWFICRGFPGWRIKDLDEVLIYLA